MPKKQIQKVSPFSGWLLICPTENNDGKLTGGWYISWMDVFGSKKSALEFAIRNGWHKPYRAVRGHLSVTEPTNAR